MIVLISGCQYSNIVFITFMNIMVIIGVEFISFLIGGRENDSLVASNEHCIMNHCVLMQYFNFDLINYMNMCLCKYIL